MLTKKQAWRRARARSSLEKKTSLTSESDDIFKINSKSDNSVSTLSNTSSCNSLASMSIGSCCSSCCSETLTDEGTPLKITRNVKFSPKVRVCLVPSRTELTPLIDKLYWNQSEYISFKQEAILEIRELLLVAKTLNGSSITTPKEAQISLYQPELDFVTTTTSVDICSLKNDTIDSSDDCKSERVLYNETNNMDNLSGSKIDRNGSDNSWKQEFNNFSHQFRITSYQTSISSTLQLSNSNNYNKNNDHTEGKDYYESEKSFESEVDVMSASQSLNKCLNTIRRRDSVQLFKMYNQSDTSTENEEIDELISNTHNYNYNNVSTICIS